MIHPLSDCQAPNIPSSTNIWQFCVVLPGAQIGENCNICSHCFIENDVRIGENVLVGAGSVVTCDIPAGEVWAGNPARFIRRV